MTKLLLQRLPSSPVISSPACTSSLPLFYPSTPCNSESLVSVCCVVLLSCDHFCVAHPDTTRRAAVQRRCSVLVLLAEPRTVSPFVQTAFIVPARKLQSKCSSGAAGVIEEHLPPSSSPHSTTVPHAPWGLGLLLPRFPYSGSVP